MELVNLIGISGQSFASWDDLDTVPPAERIDRRLTPTPRNVKFAESLRKRMERSNVTVLHGDGAEMPFEDGSFTGAVSFTLLHHIASASLQDRLFREVFLVLAPGGVFAGTDSLWSLVSLGGHHAPRRPGRVPGEALCHGL
jgi:SAM-dependent methyltransferase